MSRRPTPSGERLLPSRPLREQLPDRAATARTAPRVAGTPTRRRAASPSAEAESSPPRGSGERRGTRRRIGTLLALALVAVVGAVAAVVLLRPGSAAEPTARSVSGGPFQPGSRPSGSSGRAPGSTRPAPPPAAEAATWVVGNLPASAPVLTDPATARLLFRAGHAAVQSDPTAWRSADYVVETPQLRAQARSVGAASSALSSAVEVASFGTGSRASVVARLLPDRQSAALAAAAADAQDRATGDRQLLRNHRVRIAAQARQAFSSGSVDLRAATLVALMARSADVAVTAADRVPAEDAAGLPVRRLSISVADPSALPDALAMLPTGYRPSAVTGSSVKCRVTWPVQVPPFSSVH